MSSFDLTTPPLTVELKKILNGYPLGGQIIKVGTTAQIKRQIEQQTSRNEFFAIDFKGTYSKRGRQRRNQSEVLRGLHRLP
jgi:hypothetical protein